MITEINDAMEILKAARTAAFGKSELLYVFLDKAVGNLVSAKREAEKNGSN